jgi:hypothetical protein
MTNVLTSELNVKAVPAARAAVRIRQVRVYRHSTMFYWWPAWAFGFAIALFNEGQQGIHTISESQREGSALGLSYVCILLLLIVFTNVRDAPASERALDPRYRHHGEAALRPPGTGRGELQSEQARATVAQLSLLHDG